MTDHNTSTTGSRAGVPTELWNQKKRKLRTVLDAIKTHECVVAADGAVTCDSTGSAHITGDITLDARKSWTEFSETFAHHTDLGLEHLSSTDRLVPTDTDDRMEKATRVTVSFAERTR